MRNCTLTLALTFPLAAFLAVPVCGAAEPRDDILLSGLPVKDIMVFKDGHAFIHHEGAVPLRDDGTAVLDGLPVPVLGTFWSSGTAGDAVVTRVTASSEEVETEQKAQDLFSLLRANIGKEVGVTDADGETVQGVLKDMLENEPSISSAGAPEAAAASWTPQSSLVLIQTEAGLKALPFSRVRDAMFLSEPSLNGRRTETRGRLTFAFDTDGAQLPAEAVVSVSYVQKGIRWIPGYRIDLDGERTAKVRLQATVLNELADVENATVHLVVGVPSLKFTGNNDPMSLQKTVAELTEHFAQRSPMMHFSNTIMTQMASNEFTPMAATAEPAFPETPELVENSAQDDLHIFTLDEFRLAKGACTVVQLAQFESSYEDLYTVSLPARPANVPQVADAELARLLEAPKAMHAIRLGNTGEQPFTTAPVLISKNGVFMAQSMMKYTPAGSTVTVDVTTAVNVLVKVEDLENGRVHNAKSLYGAWYDRVDSKGTISIGNRTGKDIRIQVIREVGGVMTGAESKGRVSNHPAIKGQSLITDFNLCHWEWWWNYLNGIGRAEWEVEMPALSTTELVYNWYYYTR